MAIKLIPLRAFMTEISSGIVSANERLLSDAYSDISSHPREAPTKATPLEIKSVRVSFSAHIVNRRLLNTKSVRQDEILLDFTTEGKKRACNIYGEMVFSGAGDPIELEEWPAEEGGTDEEPNETGGNSPPAVEPVQDILPEGGDYEACIPPAEA